MAPARAQSAAACLSGAKTTLEPQIRVEELGDPEDPAAGVEDGAREVHSHTALPIDLHATHLISSPYADPANQLRLGSLDLQSRLFAFALSYLHNIRDDYATAPYMAAFNWPSVFEVLQALCWEAGVQWRTRQFYVVIFRSQLRERADRVRLGELDQRSHEEACASGGLLRYWFGSPDAEMRNLATCVWVAKEDASVGGGGPWHKKARGAAREMYEHISFHTHTLVVGDNVSSWELEDEVV